MRTLARVGLVVLAVVFGLVFLFELLRLLVDLRGAPMANTVQDAAIALACATGFAACWWKSRQLVKAQKASEAAAAVFRGSRLEADINKPILIAIILLIVSAMAFGVFQAWVAPSGKVLFFVGLGLVLGVFLLGSCLGYFRSGKPTLLMDSYSLDHAWYGPIRWDQIHGIFLQKLTTSRGKPQYTLVLGVTKPGRYLLQLPLIMRMLVTRKRRDAATGVLRIPLNFLSQPAALIHAAAVDLRSRVSPPPVRFWHPDMSAEQIALQRETDETLARMEQLTASIPVNAPVSARQEEDMQRLSDDLVKQLEAGKPFREQELAKLRRVKRQAYVVTGLVVVYFLLRLWWIFHKR